MQLVLPVRTARDDGGGGHRDAFLFGDGEVVLLLGEYLRRGHQLFLYLIDLRFSMLAMPGHSLIFLLLVVRSVVYDARVIDFHRRPLFICLC